MSEFCEKHKINFEVVTGKVIACGFFHGYSDCPKCREEYEARYIQKKIAEANIPSRFACKGFDDFSASTPAQKNALSTARNYADAFPEHFALGRCLTFCGRPGTGKTHLASAIGTSLLRSERKVCYWTVPDLIRKIRSYWGSGGDGESVFLDSLQSKNLIILDEVGLQYGTDGEIQHMTEVIDRRYRETRPTLVISNHPISELGKFLGERAVDRLRDNGGIVTIFDWESYRASRHQ